jgi:hypothetical protein
MFGIQGYAGQGSWAERVLPREKAKANRRNVE